MSSKMHATPGGVSEMAEAVAAVEGIIGRIDADVAALDTALENMKTAKDFGPGDGEAIAELRDRAKLAYSELAKRRRDYARLPDRVYRGIRNIHLQLVARVDEAAAGTIAAIETDEDPGGGEGDPIAGVLAEAGIDATAIKALAEAGVTTREQFAARVEADDLTKIKGIGKATAKKIAAALASEEEPDAGGDGSTVEETEGAAAGS